MTATALDLMPGDVAVGLAGDAFRTLLGSCVSVILTDPKRTVGAMCHIVHVGQPNIDNQDNTAYGAAAMAEMFARLHCLGINPTLCEAYVYGGSNMFPELFNQHHVGVSNARWALQFLQDHGIAVRDCQVGGTAYRKVAWTVGLDTPAVFVVDPAEGASHDS